EHTTVSLRQECVTRATQEGANISALCRQYGISRNVGYKWIRRSRNGDLADRPRTPHHQPRRCAPDTEAAVVAMRARHPHWGGRKLEVKLRESGLADVPRPRTITAILQRHGVLTPRQERPPPATRRFEHAAPHDLWQMDVMGHRALQTGRVHPLTIRDDHSRVLLSLTTCPQEQLETVWAHLEACFIRYGLPRAILTDHGPPWGTSRGGITRLDAWLLRLGVELWHGRFRHPQTQGTVERIHETISVEAFGTRTFRDLAAAQAACDAVRMTSNLDRPHEALDYAVPMSRLQPSPRLRPDVLPLPVYASSDAVRRVRSQGAIGFANRSWFVSRGLIGEDVAVRPTTQDGVYTVHFCHRQVGHIDLHQSSKGVTYVSEHR
ncbi:MAG: IS481 family transposase, partial [Chloroflexota bacterium]|nr:IS481 family transposase [Chloroflexota bacterium]